jgi:hypothetical protein
MPREFRQSHYRRWGRFLLLWGGLLLMALVIVLLLWNTFWEYVPPGKHLIVISKDGDPLPSGQILAEPGQKGIHRAVLGEGWHFIMPIVYTTELANNTVVPAGKVGIVTARGGKPLPPGRLLAETGEQGIQRHVLPPGTYRINTYGFDVTLVDAVEIKAGYVGVLRRLLGRDGTGRFAERPDEKGILRQVLQPGLYFINTKEFEVVTSDIGIFQSTFHYDADPQRNTAISFTSKGGFTISMDCTIEWEVLPEQLPAIVADFGSRDAVERTVIDVQAHAIGRDKGIDYGAQDLLEGIKREKFQEDFTQELMRVCKEKNVTVHSAFIRNIVIPEAYLKPIRDKQIAAETELTNRAKELTAQTEAEVEQEKQTIQQRVAEVEAETQRIVAALDREVENVVAKTQAELEKTRAEYEAKIADLDAQRTQLVGEADAEVTRLKELAQNSLYQLKMQVFQNDANAFLRYTLADKINPKMMFRVFHSGPGTFWTNLENKNMSLLLPTPANDKENGQQQQSGPR